MQVQKKFLPQYLLLCTIRPAFNKKITKQMKMAKIENVWNDKTIIRNRHRYEVDVGNNKDFKIAIINMLKALYGKVDHMEDQIDIFIQEIETTKIKWKC